MSTTLHKDDRGHVYAEGNEVFIEDLVPGGDPVALCLHSINETIGKFSIRMRVGGSWKEVGFVGFKRDERGRTDPAHRDALEVEVWTHIPGRGFEDPDYRRMFVIRHDGVTGIAAPSDRMTSLDGRFVTVQQGDGNFVTYDTALGPVGNTSAAVWSAWSGKV